MQKDRSLERPERWKHHLPKTAGMFYCAERQDLSVQRPERWKRYFLKRNCMFYCAERQDLSVQRPERWKRYFLKRNCMFYFVQNDRRRGRNAHFRRSNRMFDFWSEGVFVGSPTRKHHFRLGTKGRCYFRIFKMTDTVGETPTFDFRIVFPTFGRRVFL